MEDWKYLSEEDLEKIRKELNAKENEAMEQALKDLKKEE